MIPRSSMRILHSSGPSSCSPGTNPLSSLLGTAPIREEERIAFKRLTRSGVEQPPRRHGGSPLSWISLVPPIDYGLTTRSRWPAGIRYSSLRSFARLPTCAGHVLAVGSMVPKATPVRQFRLNPSLHVSGLT
eukprot:Gb_15708 [translate_table: standard]